MELAVDNHSCVCRGASPVLLDFFRPAAYNQIRSNQGYFRVSGCTFCFQKGQTPDYPYHVLI